MSRIGWLLAVGAVIAAVGSVAAWRLEPATASPATGSLDGATLFQAKGCAACHIGPDSAPSIGSPFPSLADAASWAGDRRPGHSASAYLSESMRDPAAFISAEFSPGGGPPMVMPVLALSDAEVEAIVDYLLAD